MTTIVNDFRNWEPGLDPSKYKDHQKRKAGGRNGGEERARLAFYDLRNRPSPSLPKLKFLEGKD